MQTFRKKLEALSACSDACEWVGDKSATDAWQTCDRGDWMLWLLGRISGPPDSDSRRKLVGIAAECAERALPIYENKHHGDTRVRDCIEGCKRYAAGDPSVTLEQLRVLQRAAYAAAYAAYAAGDAAYAAGDAACAAGDAAYAAGDAAYAAGGVGDVAAVAAYAAAVARISTLKQCADIVRKHYPGPPAF